MNLIEMEVELTDIDLTYDLDPVVFDAIAYPRCPVCNCEVKEGLFCEDCFAFAKEAECQCNSSL